MNVLLVTYYYPPMGGAGVQRALKFSKYLGEFGIQVSVLAAHNPGYVQDASLLAEVPAALAVRRVEHRPWLQRVMAARKPAAHPAAHPAAAAPAARTLWRDAALRAYATLHFPDDRAGWARRAFAVGRALMREQRIDLVLSTAPPMSAHALGARLARTAGVPWVADYRDLWTDNPAYTAPAWRAAFDRRTEARWLRQAAGVVTVTPSWRERFAAQLGAGRAVAFIPNGYDEADFAAAPPPPRQDDAFRLVHTGTFYGPRDPGTLLDGIGLYLRHAPPRARPLRLRLVGNMGGRFAQRLRAFEQQHPGVVEQRAYVPHHEAIQEMRGADALLLLVGAGQGTAQGARAAGVVAGTLPGKIFEYLRAGPPVLLLGDAQGDAAALLRQHSRGWVADETRPQAIADALRQMMGAQAPPPAPLAGVAQFERRTLAAEMARFLVACRG